MSASTPVSKRGPDWRTVLEFVTTVVMIALGAAVVWQGWGRTSGAASPAARSGVSVPSRAISIANRPTLGGDTAKVAIVEYSDFECPYCGTMARETIPTLIREYVDPGAVVLSFKHLPLPIHALAPGAAASTVCAFQQGKFWQMHDRLFTKPVRLEESHLRSAAREIGIDLASYDSCRAGQASSRIVEEDLDEAGALGVSGTPTFFIGSLERRDRVRVTDVLAGARPLSDFKRILDRLLEGASQ